MGKKAPKVPAPPDPAVTAAAQAKANQITQLTPQGNQVYGTYENGQFTPAEGNTAIQVTESPFQQALRAGGEGISLDLLNSLQLGGAGALSGVRTASEIEQGLSPLSQDFSGDAMQAQRANYDANLALLQPQMDRDRSRIEQRLADQGLPIGSQAYNDELNRLEQSQAGQLQQLSQSSVAAGNDRSNQLAQLLQSQQAQQFNTQSGLQNQENQARAAQFGELGALLGFSSPFQQFQTTGVDVAGITNQNYQNQLGAYNAKAGAQSGNMAALGGLAGAGLSAAGGPASLFGYSLWGSDINIKENIKLVGKENGFNIYDFNYIGKPERYRGVMAQEVQRTNPAAVIQTDEGLKVNYGAIGIEFKRIS